MLHKKDFIKIGTISRTHGVKGELVLMLNDDFEAGDFNSEFAFLDIDNGLVPFVLNGVRPKSNKALIMDIETIACETRAKQFCGTEVYMPKSDIEQAEDNSLASFVNYAIIDKSKGAIGVIVDVQNIEKNPIFIVDNDGKEILVPISDDLILSVDSNKGEIIMNIPEGLIDLYLNDD